MAPETGSGDDRSSGALPGFLAPAGAVASGSPAVNRRLQRAFYTSFLSFMLLVIALGSIAVVNGLWSKTLLVNGEVTTGDLRAVWGEITTMDNEAEEDDLAVCAVESGANADSVTAVVSITDAYPSYQCAITAEVLNVGSVPFNIIDAIMEFPMGQTELEWVDTDCTIPEDPQVDPGQQDATISCSVHVVSSPTPAEPGTYFFTIRACVAQWNEAANFATCVSSSQGGPGDTP